MRNIKPKCIDTIIEDDNHIWIPISFSNFLTELKHLINICSANGSLILFRGHSNHKWLLESTIARSCKNFILGIEPFEHIPKRIQESREYHLVIFNILLLKYGVIVRPVNEETPNIDSWYELMRDFQQYPEKDHYHFKGTFFLDWTRSENVGLFFANFNRKTDGALWICDATATGATLQQQPLGAILDLMNQRCNSQDGEAAGVPLIFEPQIQNYDEKTIRQKAIYVAQMDMRFDLASIWRQQEKNGNERDQIFVKLILPHGTQEECNAYLMKQGITESWLFPDLEC